MEADFFVYVIDLVIIEKPSLLGLGFYMWSIALISRDMSLGDFTFFYAVLLISIVARCYRLQIKAEMLGFIYIQKFFYLDIFYYIEIQREQKKISRDNFKRHVLSP